MGSEVKGVYQLQGGIERYLQAFPDGGYWRGKNFVFDKREAVGAGNVNGDGGVIRKEGGKKSSKEGSAASEKLLSWGTECAKCKKPWDRYVGKRKCYTCGVPILVCDECMSQSSSQKKNKKRKSGDKAEANPTHKEDRSDYSLDKTRCPLCIEEGVTVPAEQVEYTDNGVHIKKRSNSFSEGGEESNSATELKAKKQNVASTTTDNSSSISERKAAKSVLKWGGGHAAQKKEKRKLSRKLCQFGVECVRKDCFFYHPEREGNKK